MATIKKILCAIDLTKARRTAFDRALSIVLHANSRKADLVVGSNRRRGWRRFREGSAGDRVLRRAAWAVLIVPWDIASETRLSADGK